MIEDFWSCWHFLSVFRVGLCVFSGYKIYPGMGKTLVKTDGRVSENCANPESCGFLQQLSNSSHSHSSTRSASARSWWSATRARSSGPSSTAASTRRVSRRRPSRSVHVALWNTPEPSSVPPWLTSWPRETWNQRSARLNATKPSSEFRKRFQSTIFDVFPWHFQGR